MSNQEGLVSEFSEITGTDIENAKFYLSSSNWNLEVALSCFYDTLGTSMTVDGAGGGGPPSENESEESVQTDLPERVQPAPKPQKLSKNRLGTMAGLRSMESSDNEERQAFYAGGSEHSGQQVLGPERQSADDSPSQKDFISSLLQESHDHGSVPEDLERGQQSVFTGVGYRLGQTTDDSTVVGDDAEGESASGTRREVTLKLWREGFNIDDGPLRSYSDPANLDFLNRIRRGRIPDELLSEAQGGTVNLSMQDHRHDTFTAPKMKVKAFSGTGHLLGSPTPNIVCEDSVKSGDGTDEKSETSNPEFTIDNSQPTTTVQVRLADGSRLQVTFNHSHTIRDLRKYIVTARPQYENAQFSLMTTYPSRELNNDDLTLEEAGILSSSILQRLK